MATDDPNSSEAPSNSSSERDPKRSLEPVLRPSSIQGPERERGSFSYELHGSTPLDPAQRAALVGFAITDRPTAASAERASRALELLGQGVGIVDASGEITWMNRGLARKSPETMRRFSDCCVDAIMAWRRSRATATTLRGHFRSEGAWYDVVMTPLGQSAAGDSTAFVPVEGAVALLIDATATRRLQDRLDAIDAAGVDLIRLDAEAIRSMNAAERLRALEGRVVAATRDVLAFDHFEYRLIDRRSGQLELVFCSGLVPLGIGERLYARPEGNGLSGLVATSGESIVCPDVAREPRYLPGLPGARSSLTVPLRLHDRVIGVLNVESVEPGRFDDEDRIGSELLGRYVALALNVLDMLVAERCETHRTLLGDLARESATPLGEIAADARALHELAAPDAGASERSPVAEIAIRLARNVARLDDLVRSAALSPRGILGADDFLREGRREALFAGRLVAVADDDASIRNTVVAVLSQQGCEVRAFADGAGAIRAVREAKAAGRPFDLVVSDVRMPDANGYEVFRATKDADPRTPVILMTAFGYDPNHAIVRSTQEGLHCLLFKPFQVSQLLEEARKALVETSPAT